jgi:cation diffusion facilitator CzcD-associated flavoprotein CzcO
MADPPGLCTAIDLLQRGIKNFVVLEKSAGLGGTWRDNKYPGCCCDGEYGRYDGFAPTA